MSMYSAPRRAEGPRRVRNGLKLRWVDAPPAAQGWIAQRWLESLPQMFDAPALEQGLTYARSGQTVSLDILPGAVQAEVQGRHSRPYALTFDWPTIAPGQWEQVISAMAGEAMYAAKLLGGELPAAADPLCRSLGVELIPPMSSIRFACRCTDQKPCKHLAAAAYLLAERLEDDPLLIFTLRGMPAPLLIERLRAARAVLSGGSAAAHGEHAGVLGGSLQNGAAERGGVASLQECVDDYWRPGPELSVLEQSPPPQHISHALLRRLGPSPLGGKFPLVGLLASVYDAVAEAAIRMRDEAEGLSAPGRVGPVNSDQ